MIYVQEYAGQKLHLVQEYGESAVSSRALCGRTCDRRGAWRLAINLPLGLECKRCSRVYRAIHGVGYRPVIDVSLNVNIGG
jgi:hypothetical protein